MLLTGAFEHAHTHAGYPNYAYDQDNAYQQYASQEQYRQWADYAAQQQYADSAAQANYYNWAAANAYKQEKKGDVLKVAGSKSNAQSLVYMGDLEFGGYRHEITGGNDGGYNAPFDINGDGQEIDNWAKVTTQWKHKKGGKQLKQATSLSLSLSLSLSVANSSSKRVVFFTFPPSLSLSLPPSLTLSVSLTLSSKQLKQARYALAALRACVPCLPK